MSWRVAKSLLTLRDQINARFPKRNKASDGTIGDAAHRSRESDHNPWYRGIVTAADFTHDPGAGFDIDRFTDELAATRDRRIKYVIANRLILDTRPGFNPWRWMPYRGSNPHTRHVHISVMPEFCDDDRAWNIPMLGKPAPSRPVSNAGPFPLPRNEFFGLITGPARSHGGYYAWERPHVKRIQQALIRKGYVPGIRDVNSRWADGIYEKPTADAVARWQRAEMPATTRFGEVWWDDWAALLR